MKVQLSDAYRQFLGGFLEVRQLLTEASRASTAVADNRFCSPQQSLVRAAVVLLAAHLEGFLRRLPEDFCDALPDSWGAISDGQRRYLVLCGWRQLCERIELHAADAFRKAGSAESARRQLVFVSRWLMNPSRFSEADAHSQLRDFYKLRGAQSVEQLTRDFDREGRSVFESAESRGLDRGSLWTVVEGLIEARNQIAHGEQSSLTPKDLRKYCAACVLLVRQTLRHFGETQ